LAYAETPALLNALHQDEMQAAMSTAQPKGDHARLADFQAAHPGEGIGPLFYRWLTLNQCDARKAVQLELEARGQANDDDDAQRAMTFHPGMRSHTFHPPSTMAHTFRPGETMGDATEANPLKRQATPLAEDEDSEEPARTPNDNDISSMTFPRGVTLKALQQAGIVHEAMTETEFAARLKRVHMDEHDRWRLTAAAYEAGYFGGRTLSVPYTQPWSSPQGDTLRERSENQPVRTQRDRLRIANEINAACDRIKATLHPSTGKGRVIHGRAQDGC
jgi:hypothetical protein